MGAFQGAIYMAKFNSVEKYFDEAATDATEMFNCGVPSFALVKNRKTDREL